MQGTSYKLCGKACSVKKLPLTSKYTTDDMLVHAFRYQIK